jgi:glycosyltransferase involved in cell wall biosynthesis
MRVAIHNRHWSTAGGGERYAGGIAEVLARRHDVTLLAPEPVDLEALSERLQLDLGGVSVEAVGPGPEAVLRASARADLFVNASFGSDEPSAAPHSLYVTFFPTLPDFPTLPGAATLAELVRPPDVAAPPALAALTGGRRRSGRAVVLDGFHRTERVARVPLRWTDGSGRLDVQGGDRSGGRVTVALARLQPRSVGDLPVEVRVDERPVATAVVAPRHGLGSPIVLVQLPPLGPGRHLVELASPAWRPADHGAVDGRRLGVPVVGVFAGNLPARLAAAVADLAPARRASHPTAFLGTYQRIVAVSRFTEGWIRRRWGRDSVVLPPPVVTQPVLAKQPVILAVGRFFDPASGHGKHQLELVEGFRALRGAGGAEGWELHLAGGCEPTGERYLATVRRAAAGLPVSFHVGATGAALRRLYGEASLFWHATGLGEDLRHPERFEHFGITTVEAMSAGAVPLVFAGGGQLELFEPGRGGVLWTSPRELVAATRDLVADPARRARLSEGARDAARPFLAPAFGDRLERLVDELLGTPHRPGGREPRGG